MLKGIGVTIRPLWLSREAARIKIAHCCYLFRFDKFPRDDRKATRLAESFVYGVTLMLFPLVERGEDVLTFRVPHALVAGTDTVPAADLVDLEERRPWEERTLDFPHQQLGYGAYSAAEVLAAGWRIAALAIREERLFRALRFLNASKEDFDVAPGELREILCSDEEPPRTTLTQTRFENALQNAFKAIEAVIGDPPKDDGRLFRKIRDVGLDPGEMVGYGRKMPLHEAIRWANDARDKKSAHGSTKKRKISVLELLNHQSCAEHVIWAALENTLGEPIFPHMEEEPG
ncbi:MAG: hypothetical protein ACOC7S_01055 [Planctomycetota bacterium]